MNKVAGLFISLITSLVGAWLAAYVLTSTAHLGLESILLAGLAALVVLAFGALIYSQMHPQD